MMQDEQQNPADNSIRRARHDDYGAFCRLFPELMVDDPVPGLEAWSSLLSPSTWIATLGGEVLGPSPEYAETRRFYASVGYTALEMFPELWGPRLPVLQLVKGLPTTLAAVR